LKYCPSADVSFIQRQYITNPRLQILKARVKFMA
jgi:hypothetical protein